MIPAIGSIRLSNWADDSTSPPRQKGHIDRKAADKGFEVIAYPEDLDVSASKFSPFERPKLGPWMTDPDKLAQYDVLVLWRWDRFVRSGQDMRDVFTWAKENHKRVVSATEDIEYDPDATGINAIISELLITVVTSFAQIEVTNASIRIKDMMEHLKSRGSRLNGNMPFGTMPGVKDGIKTWVTSPETQAIVFEIVRRLRGGENRNQIANDFNERGVLAPKDWARVFYGNEPKGSAWEGGTISRIFATDSLLGYRVEIAADGSDRSKRVTVRDENGNPIPFCEPVLAKPDGSPDVETLREVQQLIAQKPRPTPREDEDSNPLHGVVKCYDCGRNLNLSQRSLKGKQYSYLLCKRAYRKLCEARGTIPVETAMEYLEDSFLFRYGNDPVVERYYVPQQDRRAELAELQTAFEAVSASLESATQPMTIERQTKRLDTLAERIAELESLPHSTGGWQVRQLDRTNAEAWESSSWEERREMLVKAGISMRIKRTPRTNHYEVHIRQEQEE